MGYDLAEVNIARLAADLDSPQLADFVDALDPINALADTAPGFRWRLQSDEGDATNIVAFQSEQGDGVGIITNLTTWRDIDSLAAFVFGPMHTAIMRRRREWFIPIREAYTVCWWVPAGHRPSVNEAEERLRLFRRLGPTPEAFTMKCHFPAPGAAQANPVDREDRFCPA
ncbi:MAG: DUF3291 domain-containing protein [Pseudonocardiales bacterium]|nr:MAG: DUF3291 domain-containing protein [Pseudonocardiales bacterium]